MSIWKNWTGSSTRHGSAPLSEADSQKLKDGAACAGRRCWSTERSTEKTSAVLAGSRRVRLQRTSTVTKTSETKPRARPQRRRCLYRRRQSCGSASETHSGDRCPDCERGKVYRQKEPKTLVRIVGQAPLAATVYETGTAALQACGQVFTAPRAGGMGPEKYDETAAAMIALLKYGSGCRFIGWRSWKTLWAFRCRRRRSGRSSKKRPK